MQYFTHLLTDNEPTQTGHSHSYTHMHQQPLTCSVNKKKIKDFRIIKKEAIQATSEANAKLTKLQKDTACLLSWYSN